jgi:hypothetical protein
MPIKTWNRYGVEEDTDLPLMTMNRRFDIQVNGCLGK